MPFRFSRSVSLAIGTVPLLAVAVLSAPAHGSVPSAADRADAKRFARSFWSERGSETLCYGVRFRFRWLPGQTIAYVPGNRTGTAKCAIVFNRRIDWTWNQRWGQAAEWWRFCRIAIHEYGHLPGMPHEFPPLHSRNPNSIMAALEETQALNAWWWPWFPDCRYEGDDEDGDGEPDA